MRKQFGYVLPARKRRPRQLKNLQVVEVSSVDRGASGDHDGVGRAQVRLLKREDEMQKKPHAGFEPFALEAAKRVVGALNLDKANKAHSDGTLSSVEYSDVLMGLARAQYPEAKDALAKYIAANQSAFSEKLRSDYEQQQKGQWLTDVAHEQQRQTGVRTGQGFKPSAAPGGGVNNGLGSWPQSAADTYNNDNPLAASPGIIDKSAIYARVVKTLMGEGLSADAAWSAVHRHERKESIGW
jgi:hypothetical protein